MPLSGKEMLKRYMKNGWNKVSKGRNIEIIPMHKELKKGLEAKLLKTLQDK